MTEMPPIVAYYRLTSATQPVVPIYLFLPPPASAGEGSQPKWVVFVPK